MRTEHYRVHQMDGGWVVERNGIPKIGGIDTAPHARKIARNYFMQVRTGERIKWTETSPGVFEVDMPVGAGPRC